MILLTFGNHSLTFPITGNVLHTAEKQSFLKISFKIRKYIIVGK